MADPIKLPAGYSLDAPAATPPSGYVLDAPAGNEQQQKTTDGVVRMSEQMGIHNPLLAAPVDLIQGIGAGVMSTVRGASQLAHKVIPAIPEVPASFGEAPDSNVAKVGKFAEQAAEFVAPIGAVSKATSGMRLLLRMGAEGLAAGGVSAVQSGGDPGATAAGAVTGAAGPAVGAAVGAAGKAIANSGIPKKLYQSALKPTWSMVKKEGLTMLDTGIKDQIPVSAEGLSMVERKISGIQKEIAEGVTAHATFGRKVNSTKVLSALDDLETFYANTAAPKKAMDTLKGLREQFLEYHGKEIPLDQAQQIKINTYQDLKNSYGEMSSAKVEGLKQIARGLKDEISSVFPEVAGMNEQQSKLLGLGDALYRAVWRIENHQMMGIGSPLAASAGGALMGGPGAIMGFAGKLLLDDPTLKSKLAISLAKAGVKNPSTVVGARLAALKGAMEKAASSMASGAEQYVDNPSNVQVGASNGLPVFAPPGGMSAVPIAH